MTQAHRGTRCGGRAPGGTTSDGFTLIELITVLLIIGFLSAVIVSRAGILNTDLAARSSELRSQLRYLQLMAMKNGTTYLALKSNGSSYWAYNSADSSKRIPLPGESSTTVNLADKHITSMDVFTISFDAYGIPYTGDVQTKLTANATITLTIGGENATLVVVPETGFVP
jgi:prepilin-type N-terminal cleavage/methylation domain-containing protein